MHKGDGPFYFDVIIFFKFPFAVQSQTTILENIYHTKDAKREKERERESDRQKTVQRFNDFGLFST